MATSPIYSWPEPDNTDLVKNGALAIRTLGDAIDTTMGTMVAKTIIDAKGDLIAGTAADTAARLAVGNNGETLVADSSTSTGLRWQGDYAAGKNKIINGDFGINQRAFTSTTTSAAYGFDRWQQSSGGGTTTYSAQTFTPGAAPVAGYEAANYARLVTSGQSAAGDYAQLVQSIEDVRTFAGQTVTVSFWAQAGSGTPSVAVEMYQVFGSGGSPSAAVTAIGAVKSAITTSWARYSFTFAVPSISGKTIGTTANTSQISLALWTSAGSTHNARTSSLGIQNATINFWGIQVEASNTATAFQTATGTLQGELAACQRYYYRAVADTAYGSVAPYAVAASSTGFIAMIQPPATMRVSPTSIDFSTLAFVNYADTLYAASSLTLPANNNKQVILVSGSITGATAGHAGRLTGNNNVAAYLGFSAEL